MLVVGGFVSVMVNGEESNTFKTGKGLRQGDPLSSLLFNLVGDVLIRMLKRASDRGYIKGILDSFVPGRIMTLQYADDTILFSSSGSRELRNLKFILILFEKVSGMKINFDKSEFIPMNLDADQIHEVAHVMNCPLRSLPFT
jgi:hypothetical protein